MPRMMAVTLYLAEERSLLSDFKASTCRTCSYGNDIKDSMRTLFDLMDMMDQQEGMHKINADSG